MKNIKKVAVTGATGFLAHELIRILQEKGIVVNAIARNEGKLVELKGTYPTVNIFPCPIEDKYLLAKALLGCDGVFHLASFKDVILSQEHPTKTVQTNVIGTLNVLQNSVDNKAIKFVVATSTDKVAKVNSTYGATKFIVESLFKEYESINGHNCRYRTVRYGNVLYSTGSVLVKWKHAIENNLDIVITEPHATRFFWSREDAVKFLLESLDNNKDSSPSIPTMKSVELGILLDVMIEKYGTKNNRYIVNQIGLQQGENLHEQLTPFLSSNNATKWTRDELFAIL